MNAKESARQAAADAQTAAHAAEVAIRAATPKPPDPRQAPHHDLLASFQRTALARFRPRKDRWPEVRAFDDRIVELDREQAATAAELAELRARQLQAERAHPGEVARWIEGGKKGARPEPAAPRILRRIAELEAELPAFQALIEQTAEAKGVYVRRHRKRLGVDAETARDQAKDRYLELVRGLAPARDELRATAQTVTWAALFPHDSLVSEPNLAQLVGGQLTAVREAVPGLNVAPTLPQLTRLLEADAQLVAEAVSREQAVALQGLDPRSLAAGGAVWGSTPEGREQERTEKREALAAYEREWGALPEFPG